MSSDNWKLDIGTSSDGISDRRWLFVSKTLGVVAMQILLIFIICIGCYHSPGFNQMYEQQMAGESNAMWGLMWGMFAICIISMTMTFCCVIARSILLGMIPFIIFTISLGFMTAINIIQYELDGLIQAILITALATFAAVGFVLLTKANLHSCHGVFFTLLMISVLSGFIFIIFPPSKLISILYYILGIITFVGYLMIDTSDLLRVYQEDEWMIAAMNITLDIINLFLKLLQLGVALGCFSKKK
jgi:FtsH-binding integral membrane protein